MTSYEDAIKDIIKNIRTMEVDHPSVEARAMDSIPKKMSMSFVMFSSLEHTDDGYQVTLNLVDKIGGVASMATANSLTIIPEGTVVNAGDRIQVLPLDWGCC